MGVSKPFSKKQSNTSLEVFSWTTVSFRSGPFLRLKNDFSSKNNKRRSLQVTSHGAWGIAHGVLELTFIVASALSFSFSLALAFSFIIWQRFLHVTLSSNSFVSIFSLMKLMTLARRKGWPDRGDKTPLSQWEGRSNAIGRDGAAGIPHFGTVQKGESPE